MGIETPLNTMSIALQDRRERNQNSLSRQDASATSPLVKGTEPLWIQKFKSKVVSKMKMPTGKNQKGIFPIVTGTENVKVTQLKAIRSVAATPFIGTESIYSVPPYNTKSHQLLYSKEILTQKVSEN